MIVFDLHCGDGGERFEAWFASNADFERQSQSGLVCCPYCSSTNVAKAPMAPRVAAKTATAPLARLAALQGAILKDSQWVGDRFAETARAMHGGDVEPRQVHGQATADQARALVEDGIPIAPLPLPVVPPDQIN